MAHLHAVERGICDEMVKGHRRAVILIDRADATTLRHARRHARRMRSHRPRHQAQHDYPSRSGAATAAHV